MFVSIATYENYNTITINSACGGVYAVFRNKKNN